MPLQYQPDDEVFWADIREQLLPMYNSTQLSNMRRGPAPRAVRDRVKSLVDLALSYELDAYEPFLNMKESGSSDALRLAMADFFGCKPTEIALTRNAMEGLATVLLGLDLQRGAEMLATEFCYDSNLAIINQRCAREGTVLKLVNLPLEAVTDDEIVAIFAEAITDRTSLILFPHVLRNTGRIMPVARIAALARARGVFTLVDGAHSVGHIDFRLEALGCDAFATCLHKWFQGPRGTGFLYIREDRIKDVWPIHATWSGKPASSIEKFEEVGTVFKALPGALPEALAFNRFLTMPAKAARFRYLRDRWLIPLAENNRVKLLTQQTPDYHTGFGAFMVEGMDAATFHRRLAREYDINISLVPLNGGSEPSGLQVSPHLSNSVEEIDRLVGATATILA
ncbi:aminotransferase class V-fold PLP-dependent enzyme [Pararhizobium sp.]|uniref:aminotransferase class V-fold PLP-dependent enzyme n=1 Tax=Pararhizobium sp. TaxID=1977563 RepID=UPI00271BE570|nr:aminotransferase class V-fold PLP-dependent enzyme [Pararhizobium sp.]MDO9415520.1 aminotransferase class V-fold PLP-dependent enzyme [Pararhizobium sp.]